MLGVLGHVHREPVGGAEPADRGHAVVDRGMAEAGGSGEHQHREAVAARLGGWRGPRRLTATAAKHQDGHDRGDGDRPSDGAASGRREMPGHGGKDTSMSCVPALWARSACSGGRRVARSITPGGRSGLEGVLLRPSGRCWRCWRLLWRMACCGRWWTRCWSWRMRRWPTGGSSPGAAKARSCCAWRGNQPCWTCCRTVFGGERADWGNPALLLPWAQRSGAWKARSGCSSASGHAIAVERATCQKAFEE